MNVTINDSSRRECAAPLRNVAGYAPQGVKVEAELAKHLPHLTRMSEQLKQTSAQIESAVVGVCESFQGIAQRARDAASRAVGFLSREGTDDTLDNQSFEALIKQCSGPLRNL